MVIILIQPPEPGMQAKIENAIRPLTGSGEFQLQTVAYGTLTNNYIIGLRSKEIAIYFDGLNWPERPGILCNFYLRSQMKSFAVIDLFQAMGIDIILSKRYTLFDTKDIFHREPYPHIEIRPYTAEQDKVDFYTELARLCQAFEKNWEKIQSLFNSDTVDETIQRYKQEYQKHYGTTDVFRLIGERKFYQHLDNKIQTPIRITPNPPLEDIIQALEPLDSVCDHSTITSHMLEGRVDVTTYFKKGTSLRLFFHTNENGETELYFTLIPNLNFLMNREDLRPHNRAGVLSGKNVFSFLGIEYVYHPKGFVEDIREYSQLIRDNSDKIVDALVKKSENTYTHLSVLPGNKEGEINEVFDGLIDLVDR